MSDTLPSVREAILLLLEQSNPAKSVGPTDIARHLLGNNEKQWRTCMKPIREAAIQLALEGKITLLRKGKPVDPNNFKGVYRIALKVDDEEAE